MRRCYQLKIVRLQRGCEDAKFLAIGLLWWGGVYVPQTCSFPSFSAQTLPWCTFPSPVTACKEHQTFSGCSKFGVVFLMKRVQLWVFGYLLILSFDEKELSHLDKGQTLEEVTFTFLYVMCKAVCCELFIHYGRQNSKTRWRFGQSTRVSVLK